ncbi:MAG: hypothetical protein PVJ09_04310 [Candidatus Woesebacteria bacterium]|jgi:hypothetical protein
MSKKEKREKMTDEELAKFRAIMAAFSNFWVFVIRSRPYKSNKK